MIDQLKRKGQEGNVLFLILIAVALFAALSYVVTQSTRSGGGSTEREKNVLSSAGMTQYPTALRTAVIRMILGGVGVENIKFNDPSNFGSVSSNQLVFHPNGGGATYQQAPADLSSSGNSALTWYYNANFDVPGVGTDGAGGNDVIAFLPGVSQGVCKQVNEELGINPDTATCTTSSANLVAVDDAVITTALIQDQMDNTYVFPTTNQVDLQGEGGSCTAFSRQASGCFTDAAATPTYTFYSVLLER
jgi:hypothetical protein